MNIDLEGIRARFSRQEETDDDVEELILYAEDRRKAVAAMGAYYDALKADAARLQKRLALAEAVCDEHETPFRYWDEPCGCPAHRAWREARGADR